MNTDNRRKKRGGYCGRADYTPFTKKKYGIPLTPEETLEVRNRIHKNNKASKAIRSATIEGRAHNLYYDAQTRSTRQNLPFTITHDWIKEKLRIGTCERTGIKFDLNKGANVRANKYGPSLDQKVSGLGYTPENCRVVVWVYNLAKCDFTDSDLLDFARCLLQKQIEETGI